jgi:tetratricopeptide (TPR) repeat protein
VATFLLLGLLAPLGTAKNEFKCTVVDEKGTPIAKQEFILTGAGKEFKKKTNDKGQVEFGGLDDGSYQLQGTIEGYVLSKSSPMEIAGNVEKPCTYTLMTAAYANSLLMEVQGLLQKKDYPAAQEKGKKTAEMLPNESAAHYMVAVAYAYTGNEEDSSAAMKKAAELNPEQYEKMIPSIRLAALDAQVKAADAKKDLDGMMKIYERMLEATEEKGTVYYNMATSYARYDKLDEALKSIDKAIELNPADAESKQLKIRLQDMYLQSTQKGLEIK